MAETTESAEAKQDATDEKPAGESDKAPERKPDEKAEEEPQGTDWKAEARKWENRAKSDAAKLAGAESELAKLRAQSERASLVAEVAKANGVDAELLAAMAGDSREQLERAAGLIAEKTGAAGPARKGYPKLDDQGAVPDAKVSKESIEAIKDPVERVRARTKHIDLYK